MAVWQHITTGFDACDETINFGGTRAFAQSEGYIYETSTFATIQAGAEVTEVPSLTAKSVPTGGICVSVDSSLTFFTDDSCSEVLFSTAFDSKIDTFCPTPDGNFLFVGLNNGFIHCLHIPKHGEVVYSKSIGGGSESARVITDIIVHEMHIVDVYAVLSSGSVMKFEGFDFQALDAASMSDDTDTMKMLVSQVFQHTVCERSKIAPVTSVTTLVRCKKLMLLAVGQGFAISSDSDENWNETTFPKSMARLVKVESLKDKTLFLALNTSGQLLAICPDSLRIRRAWSGLPLADFQLLGSVSAEAHVLGITQPDTNGQSHLILMSVQGFQQKFTLGIGWPASLMAASSETEDHLFFLESLGEKGSSQIDTIAIKAAVQTNPKFRLDRMLTRRKFEAAENLAKSFGLDMTLVNKARAQDILARMQPFNNEGSNSADTNQQLFKSLLAELEQIADMEFVCNCCVTAIPPDYSVAHSLLEYAKKRLELFAVNNPQMELKVTEWSQSVCGATLRLETLDMIKPVWDVEEWLSFSSAELVREVQQWVKQGCLHEAIIIWCRHPGDMRKILDSEQVVECLLLDIPSWVSLDNILVWLEYLLPPLLDVQPDVLAKVVPWAKEKVHELERLKPRLWPQCGLEYTQKILDLFSSQKMTGPFHGVDCSPLRPLVNLRCALADLCTLQTKHYVYLTLEEYLTDHAEVALTMLDKVEANLLPSLISDFLEGFVLEHKLERDTVIGDYVMRVLQLSAGWWYWEEAPWEPRVAALIPCIGSYKLRLECIVATLEEAPIPWSSTITNLAEEGLKLRHPLCSEIREKQRQVSTNLILKKYNLKASINKIDKRRLIRHIIMQDQPEMLEDIAKLVQDCDDKDNLYCIVLIDLISRGNVSKACELLHTLSDEVAVRICPRLVNRVPQVGIITLEDVEEFLCVVAARHEMARAARPPGVTDIENLDLPSKLSLSLQEVKNKFLLKRVFGKHLSIGEMTCGAARVRALQDCIQNLLIEAMASGRGSEGTEYLYQQVVYLARLLSIPVSTALTELSHQILASSNIAVATEIAKHLIDMPNAKLNTKFYELATKFFVESRSSQGSPQSLEVGQGLDVSLVALNLLYEASTYCLPGELTKTCEALGWIRSWFFVSGHDALRSVGNRDALQQWRFTPMYKDLGVAGFSNDSHLFNFPYDAFDFLSNYGDESSTFISDLPAIVGKLQNDQHDLAVFLMLSQLSSSLLTKNIAHEGLETINSSLEKCCTLLLTKLVSARQLDLDLGLGLLTVLGQEGALKWLMKGTESAPMDLQRQKPLACLGINVCRLWNLPEQCENFKRISLLSTWGLKLPEHGISGKELFRERIGLGTVLKKLIATQRINVTLLRAFCADYNENLQEVLLQHLQSVLLTWDPDPLITVGSDGTKNVVERNTQADLLTQCWDIVKEIHDVVVLRKLLFSLWEKVNFYHHEVFLVILDILDKVGTTSDLVDRRLLTTFLKSYRRIKPPDQGEEDCWLKVFPTSYGLPVMAEFRLPYNRRLIDSPQTAIKHEVNLETYKRWLDLAPTLNLSKDNICTLAVHQSVTDEFPISHNNSEWCVSMKNETLFAAVAECVAEMDNIVLAGATLFFFTSKIPPGVDQVSAASLCLQYASEVIHHTGETEYKDKVEKKYLSLATTQILHMYGLGKQCYLQQVHSPEELIHELYKHPGIVDRCRGTASRCPDINGAVQDISELHDVKLKPLQIGLIMEWLQPEPVSDINSSLDDDCFSGMSLAVRKAQQQKGSSSGGLLADTDKNILRARYIMEHGDVQEWALYLLSLVSEGSQPSVSLRLRACQCLCMLADPETLEEVSGKSILSMREYCRSLAYVKELESLGLTYSEEGFESCNKEELAALILRTHGCRPSTVSLLTQLCIDYNITNLTVWGAVLQQMVDLAMTRELKEVLPHLTQVFHVWNAPAFKKAWNLLLLAPFSEASTPPSGAQVTAMLQSLQMFPTCPILRDVDTARAIEYCFTMKRPDIAALLLPFVTSSSQQELREKILSMREPSDLLADIKNLGHGYFSLSKVMGMLSDKTSKVMP